MRAIAEGLWEVPHDTWMPGGVCFSGRMTVMRATDASLVLHSPVPLTEQTRAELAELGQVRHIVSPNLVHHLYAADAKAAYPQAVLWGAAGLREKTGLAVDRVLDEHFGAPGIQAIPLPSGPKLNETVFLHEPSRTLVVTDLVFNLQQTQGWGTPWLMRMVGCHQRLSASKSLKWVFVKDDFAAFSQAARGLAALDWDRLIMAHGEIVESKGRAALLEGLGWMA